MEEIETNVLEQDILGGLLVKKSLESSVRLGAHLFHGQKHKNIFDAITSTDGEMPSVLEYMYTKLKYFDVTSEYLENLTKYVPAFTQKGFDAIVDKLCDEVNRRNVAIYAQCMLDATKESEWLSAAESHYATIGAYIDDVGPLDQKVYGKDELLIAEKDPGALISGIWNKGTINIVTGYGGAYKTWLAMDIMMALAIGEPWLGRHETKLGGSLFLDWESNNRHLKKRFNQLCIGRGIEMPDNVGWSTPMSIAAQDRAFTYFLSKAGDGKSLIVLDSLAAMTPGIDENSKDMRIVIDRLRSVADDTGCAFLIISHNRKTPFGYKPSRGESMMRGSSAIRDAVDSALSLHLTKHGTCVSPDKFRETQAPRPFTFRLVDVDQGVTLRVVEREERSEEERKNLPF